MSSEETITIDLPEGAPRVKIIDLINRLTSARVLGIVGEEGRTGPITVRFTESDTSIETIRNLIKHCCQTSLPLIQPSP